MGVKGWTVVFRGERLKADLVAAVLEANGITAEVFGDTAYSAAMNFTEARIMVPDAEAGRARELNQRRRVAPGLTPRARR